MPVGIVNYHELVCWVVVEAGLTGTENQALAVARLLDPAPVVKRIGLREPWAHISPWWPFDHAGMFTGDSLEMLPAPDVVIGGGRKAAAAVRYLRRRGGGAVFTVFLQNPKISLWNFDLVAAPAHDGLRPGRRVMTTVAAPTPVNAGVLAAARTRWAREIDALPGPRVAVLIGGSSHTHSLTLSAVHDLAEKMRALLADGYSLMVTVSRRTDDTDRALIRQALQPGTESGRVWLWGGGAGDNPYHGFLAGADYIIVTSDSVSMISDACSTGVPVYIAPLPGASPKFQRFYDGLQARGVARIFEGSLAPYSYTPLDDAAMVAAEITKRLAGRS